MKAGLLFYHRRKVRICMWVFLCVALGLSIWLGFLMIPESGYYEERAGDLHERERAIKAARGRIYDRNGIVLADNQSVCTVTVIHNQITDPEQVIQVLSRELDIDEATVRKRVEKVSSIERIKSNVPKAVDSRALRTSWMALMWMRIMPGIILTGHWHQKCWDLPAGIIRALSAWR